MKIIVCGCGKIGTTILAALVAEGHDLVALDDDPAVLAEVTNIYDVIGVRGNGADCETLEDAGIREADLFVAVTGSDEMNMLACFLARRMGAEHTIARIRNPEYNDESLDFMKRELELSMAINPDLLAARELFDILRLPSAAKVETFSGRTFEMVELVLREDSPLDGLTLRDLRNRYDAKVLVCTVQRGEEVFIPLGDFVLKSGDRIGLTAAPSEIGKFMRLTGLIQKKARSVMLLGGSRTAFYLSKMLAASGADVKIIERDAAVAQELSDTLRGVSVVYGDGAQQELLLEEGLGETDAFVALTGMDEENILISIYAASRNVPKVISKINRDELCAMAEKLGLDTFISPRRIIADVLVQYARALENTRIASGAADAPDTGKADNPLLGALPSMKKKREQAERAQKNSLASQVETLYKLMDGKAEALEFRVNQPVEGLTSIPLSALGKKLRPNILIAGIIRGRKTIVPGGEDVILPDDRVIVLCAGHRLANLSDILADG